MNSDDLGDLKQFIDSRISQSEARTKEQIDELRTEMLEGFVGVAEATDEINKQIDERLTKIEQQAA